MSDTWDPVSHPIRGSYETLREDPVSDIGDPVSNTRRVL